MSDPRSVTVAVSPPIAVSAPHSGPAPEVPVNVLALLDAGRRIGVLETLLREADNALAESGDGNPATADLRDRIDAALKEDR